MKQFTERIYYADKELLDKLDSDFELIENKGWYLLYRNRDHKTYWRLDKWDKYQVQFFVRIENLGDWDKFDDKSLRIELLKKTKGIDEGKCIWNACGKPTLKGLCLCETHAFEEMGMRK